VKNKILEKFKRLRGITLITLIITIVLMLILAGVTISTILDDGIFTSANEASRQQHKESIIDAVRVAESYLDVYSIFDTTKEIDIVSLIDKVKDISDINTKYYDIDVNEDDQTATITHKKSGVTVDIKIDSHGNVIIDGAMGGSIIMVATNADGTGKIATNGNVNVTITYDEDIRIKNQVLTNADRFQYSIGENNWQTVDVTKMTDSEITIPVSVNGKVYARYYDGKTGYEEVDISINNIDKELPNEFNLSASSTSYSITVSGETTDKKSTTGTASEYTGIRGYQYRITDSNGNVIVDWTEETPATSFTFDLDVLQAEKGDT